MGQTAGGEGQGEQAVPVSELPDFAGRNVPGEAEDTVCYNCKAVLIERRGFSAKSKWLKGSKCSKCGAQIKGVFK